ncbi:MULTISPECIES: pyridoxal phosphate-dependent aminotransferase [Pontibacillus]|uniref:Pyridoxal phosphate-dependent aminotransferase n=1 Tax=Pontibacillus chungwhensis TaxID=265426 RepID=A0ABY8USL3_9BACI|nr:MULTISPECIES: pyridoxal phosphate-dependent aminotransferase [Pontibacillus]MCD5323110.1 pyridoxal phosphate-dependent aminotransferase [Pontibacillus sp. HN14]WIF96499.1 pyridoxal phosphate-dependent aminotransferase [Pontibacillus chungwhensis]
MKQFTYSKTLERLPEQFFAKLVDKVKRAEEGGQEMINLGQGNPDQPTPSFVTEALKRAADNETYHKYSPFRGFSFLKESVANFYKREYDVDLDPEKEVAVLFGSKTGLVEISQCFLDEGDTALVPDPGYPDYLSGVAMANAHTERMPLLKENDFLPRYDQIGEDTFHKAKLMFLNYPNNPTSATATESFFEDTIEIANKHDICVVHDFAYGAIGFDGEKPLSFLQVPGAKDVGVEMYTMSKTFNMAGWRVAFAVGNQSVIRALELVQDHYYVSLFGAVQEAAAEALENGQESVEQLVKLYESRRDYLVKGLRDIGWRVTAPEGSFFMWLEVPSEFTSESFADYLIDQVGIVVAPGIGFGEKGEGFVRIGLLETEDRLKEAVKRLNTLPFTNND